jgi:mRNA interferase YafQ
MIDITRRFRRSFRRLQNSGTFKSAAVEDFKYVVTYLTNGNPLPAAFRDHALTGDMFGYRECHIKGDLLLVYQKDDGGLIIDLVDIGTHSQIFG